MIFGYVLPREKSKNRNSLQRIVFGRLQGAHVIVYTWRATPYIKVFLLNFLMRLKSIALILEVVLFQPFRSTITRYTHFCCSYFDWFTVGSIDMFLEKFYDGEKIINVNKKQIKKNECTSYSYNKGRHFYGSRFVIIHVLQWPYLVNKCGYIILKILNGP